MLGRPTKRPPLLLPLKRQSAWWAFFRMSAHMFQRLPVIAVPFKCAAGRPAVDQPPHRMRTAGSPASARRGRSHMHRRDDPRAPRARGLRIESWLRGLRRRGRVAHGVVSLPGAPTPGDSRLIHPGDYATSNSNESRDGTPSGQHRSVTFVGRPRQHCARFRNNRYRTAQTVPSFRVQPGNLAQSRWQRPNVPRTLWSKRRSDDGTVWHADADRGSEGWKRPD